MRKILAKSINAFIYLFFVFYLLIIRRGAKDNPIFYAILLIVGAIILSIIPFFTNNCKKQTVRRFYLLSLILFNIFVVSQAVDILLVKVIASNETLINIRRYVIAFLIAFPLTSSIFTLFYTIKDYFKKGYKLQKFDIQSIGMCVNLLSYIGIIYIIFDRLRPTLIEDRKYDGIVYIKSEYSYNFPFIDDHLIYIFLIIAVYLVIYVVLELIKSKYYGDDNIINN